MPKLAEFKDNINQSEIASDVTIITKGAINGWTVGAPVAATGPNNMAITHSHAQKINLGNSKSVDLKNAVRLLVKEGPGYGNIWHTFEAKQGHKHIFTWYDLADYITNDARPYNVGYNVHISVNDPVHSPTALVKGAYNSQWGGWNKQRIEYTHSGPDQTLYISFQCKNVDGRNQGALVTLINGYLDREDDSDTTDVSNFRLIGPNPSQLVLDKSHGTTQQLGNAAWEFSLEQTSDDGQSWHTPDNDQSIRFNLKDGVTTSGTDATFWRHTQSKDDSYIMLPQGALHAEIPASDNNSKMIAGLMLANEFHAIRKVGYNSNSNFTSYNQSPDGAIPLVLKSAAGSDIWTITGTIPAPLTTKQTVTFTLLKNSKASGTKENVTIGLDTNAYLTVDPAASITTETDGTFKLTLTPAAGQNTAHNTALTLTHDGQDTKFTVTTGGAPVSKYDIKVSDQDSSAIVTGQKVYWSEKNEHYVTVSVVEHNTATPVDADINVISDNSALTVEGQLPFHFHKNGAALKVYLQPNGGGTATLTFSTAGAEDVTFTVTLGTVTSKALLVNHTELWLAAGFTASEGGEDSPLEVSYNPPVNAGEGTPPAVNYEITGTGLEVIDEKTNKNTVHGQMAPKGPKYIYLPRLVTDPTASKDSSIKFSTANDEYTPAIVTVHISSADHIKWQPSGPVDVDADSTTNLGLRLKVFDSAEHVLSAFALNVVIDSQGDAGAHFAGTSSATTYPITSAGKDGWVTLPELVVKNKTGNFSLSVSHPGDHAALNEPLKFKVVTGQVPSQINLYPKTNPTLPLSRVSHGISGNDYYAELLTPSNKPARNGDISFELSAGTANASFKDNGKLKMVVPVSSQDGTASMPTIQVEQQGTFTLLARHDALVTSELTFTIT